MTLQQLEYILAVERYRHFTRAAEACNVTQPTLSAMIQKLEDELDVRIFDRTQQPIAPTPAGILILKQAREVLVQAERINNIIAEEKHAVAGKFTLGILPTIAPYLLPRFFPALTKKFPHLDLRVSEMKTSDIKRTLLTGELEAGILADLPDFEEYEMTSLFYEQYFAYVSRESSLFEKSKVKTSDLADQELWLLDEGHCFRDQLVKFCQIKSAQASQLTYNLGSMETFMRMVESGKGVTFIPGLAVSQLSDAQRELVRPFALPSPTRHIVMLTSRDFIRHTVLNTIVEEIRSSVPKAMLSLATTQVAI
ncbi:MAG: hydrogen peroxide-inducible genes activator [Muribaculaceae bacterium]|nr:hydrogen peroxide-inducible genes activator [Muribaculaceae bacterium]